MPRTGKVEKYNLEHEILELRSKGLSQEDIAAQVKYNHQDIDDLSDFNAMTVNRYLNKKSVREFQKDLMEGKDPEEALRLELRHRMEDWEDETHELYLMMKDALKRIAREGDDWKTIKASKELLGAIEQSRKNLVTQVEEGFKRFGQIGQAKENNFVQVNNLIIGISDLLCDKCKKKVIGYVTKEDDS